MHKNLVYLLLFTLTACSPARHLKKAKAVVYNIPPVQILAANPNNALVDPMFYSEYFSQSIINALEAEGISAFIMQNQIGTVKTASTLIIEIGMAHIEDFRQMPEAPQSGLKLMLMGGFGSIDKNGESINESSHFEMLMTDEEIAQAIAGDVTADPIKILLKKASEKLAGQIAADAIQHIKTNVKK
ncbi:MAG: hypothetical protein ACPGLV_00300 [Bacteroidia bacterium]